MIDDRWFGVMRVLCDLPCHLVVAVERFSKGVTSGTDEPAHVALDFKPPVLGRRY
jgi:hypothetical protein